MQVLARISGRGFDFKKTLEPSLRAEGEANSNLGEGFVHLGPIR